MTSGIPRKEITPVQNVQNDALNSLICQGVEFLGEPIRFCSMPDTTDTWSHKINSFPQEPVTTFIASETREHFTGPFVSEELATYTGPAGGRITRRLNGEEYPLFRAIRLKGKEHALAVVTDDCFSPASGKTVRWN